MSLVYVATKRVEKNRFEMEQCKPVIDCMLINTRVTILATGRLKIL